jgi:phosphoglycolate phosphatase-like HAD superfamily hydrolase
VVAAARAHAIIVRADAAYHVLPGRTTRECIEQLCAHEPTVQRDPTLLELVIQSAERDMGRAVRSATFFPPAVAQLLEAAARGVRIVVRSDSRRDQVSVLIEQHGLESIVTLRCLDDRTAAPPVSLLAPDYPALERLWHDIDRRLTNLAIPRESRAAQEAAPAPQAVANAYAAFEVRPALSWTDQ